jgi:hypothetical protein
MVSAPPPRALAKPVQATIVSKEITKIFGIIISSFVWSLLGQDRDEDCGPNISAKT